MKYVRQRTDTECGIACVAMLADVGYEKARHALSGPNHNGTGRSEKDQMRKALTTFGVIITKRLVRCARHPSSKRDALVRTNVGPISGNWHWAVWDATQQKFLDPLPYKRGFHPYSCLVVLRRLRRSKSILTANQARSMP